MKVAEWKKHTFGLGREERVWTVPVAALGGLHKQEQWAEIYTIIIVERFRYLWNKTTHKLQFYLRFLPVDAPLNGCVICQHWIIENQEHGVLDVTFGCISLLQIHQVES